MKSTLPLTWLQCAAVGCLAEVVVPDEAINNVILQRDTKPGLDADSVLGNAVAFFDPPFYPNIPSILMTGNGCERGSADIDTGNASSSDPNININSGDGASALASSPSSPSVVAGNNGMATSGSWTLTFRQFTAQDGRSQTIHTSSDSTPAHSNARNCQTHVSVGRGPPGWQVAIKTVTVRGFASLAPGSVLTATGTAATFLMSGGGDTPARTTRTATLINDRVDDMAGLVTISLNFGTAGPWSSCMDGVAASSGILSINFRVAVSAGSGVNSTTAATTGNESNSSAVFGGPSTANGPVTERIKWIWQRCDPNAASNGPGSSTGRAHSSQSTMPTATPSSDTPLDQDG